MPRKNEDERLKELCRIEREYWNKGILPGGMDEVGRGPLAGPVVAACIVLPPEPLIKYVNDSKRLSPGRREKLYPQLIDSAVSVAAGWREPAEIDEINILNATKRAFKEAFDKLTKSLMWYSLTPYPASIYPPSSTRSYTETRSATSSPQRQSWPRCRGTIT